MAVNSNHVSICSGLAAIFNGKIQTIIGRISETVREGYHKSLTGSAIRPADFIKIIDRE